MFRGFGLLSYLFLGSRYLSSGMTRTFLHFFLPQAEPNESHSLDFGVQHALGLLVQWYPSYLNSNFRLQDCNLRINARNLVDVGPGGCGSTAA